MSPAEAAVAAKIREAIEAAHRLPPSGFAAFIDISLRASLQMVEGGPAHYEARISRLDSIHGATPAAFRRAKKR
jgi:hypothetical protein